MIKQKLTLSLGIVSILLGSFVAFPLKANAGKDVVPGTTSGSDSTISDTFNITTILTTTINGVTIAPNSRPGSIFLIVTQTIQLALNNFATTLFSQVNVTSIRVEVRELFTNRGRNLSALINRIRTNLLGYGVSEIRINTLIVILSQIVTLTQASEPGVPVAQLSLEQLSSRLKELKANSTIAQTGNTATVDATKLNEAIEAYNAIVKESNSDTLRKLSQDEIFIEIGQILKGFKESMKTVS